MTLHSKMDMSFDSAARQQSYPAFRSRALTLAGHESAYEKQGLLLPLASLPHARPSRRRPDYFRVFIGLCLVLSIFFVALSAPSGHRIEQRFEQRYVPERISKFMRPTTSELPVSFYQIYSKEFTPDVFAPLAQSRRAASTWSSSGSGKPGPQRMPASTEHDAQQ